MSTAVTAVRPVASARSISVPFVAVSVAALGYALLAAYFSVRRHEAFLSGYDVGILDQELWLLAHGHEPLNTQDGRLMWGDHFSMSIALLTPLYVLGLGANALLVLQALTMASVAPLLYVLARAYDARPWLAALPALLWLASPITLLANVDDVHHVPLVLPAIVGSVIAIKRDHLALFVVLATIACFTKEDVSLLYVMIGVVVALEGRRRLGAAISVASLALFVFAVAVFMPALGDSMSWYGKRFAGARGDSIADAVLWSVSNPLAALGDLVTAQNVSVCVALVLTTGGLCLLAPRWMLLGVPALAHNLFSAYSPQHELGTQYFVPVAVSFSIAAAVGAGRLVHMSGIRRTIFGAALIVAFVASTFGLLEARSGSEWSAAETALVGGAVARREAAAIVPPDVAVTASNRISPHLTHRTEAYAVPLPFLGWKELGTVWSRAEAADRARGVDWVAIDTTDRPSEFEESPERLIALLPDLGFHEVYRRGTVHVYTRNGSG